MATWSLDGLRVNVGMSAAGGTPLSLDIGPKYLRLVYKDGRTIWHHAWSEIGGVELDMRSICLLDRRGKFLRSVDCSVYSVRLQQVVAEIQANIDRVRFATSVHDAVDPRLLFIRDEAKRRDRG